MSDPQQPPREPHQQHQVPPHVSQQPAHQQPAPQQQGYALNGQTTPSAQATGNPAGRAGLILGLAGLGVTLITSILFQFLVGSGNVAFVAMLNALGSLLAFAASLAALVLGFVGLRRVGAPHAAAGIAAGLGIAGVVSIAFSFLINTIGALLYF